MGKDISSVRRGWLTRVVAPTVLSPAADAKYRGHADACDKDTFGPVNIFFRFKSETERDRALKNVAKKVGGTVSAMFPRTHRFLLEHGRDHKFRWLSYKCGVLRVCVGRASKDSDVRECPVTQVLREWHGGAFRSLHDLFCAVEASWVIPGTRELLDDRRLAVDADRGPSFPLPPALPVALPADTAVVLSPAVRGKSSVVGITCLAFGAPNGATQWLYSGTAGGKITKWDLNTNVAVVSVQALIGDGVNGLLLDPTGSRLYVWGLYTGSIMVFDCEGADLDQRQPLVMDVCTVDVYGGDEDEDEGKARVGAASVILIPPIPGTAHFGCPNDVLVVALNARGHCLSDRDDNVEFEDCEFGAGNILLMNAVTGATLGTIRGHVAPVRAIAFVGDRYLLSVSSHIDAGDIVMWCVPALTPHMHS